ncbi:MAG: hypothetical protein ACHWZW_02720 [Spirulina sp.]
MTSEISKDVANQMKVALFQATAEVELAQSQLESAIRWLKSSLADAERAVQEGNFCGQAFIQDRGNRVDAASAQLSAAIKGKAALEYALKGLGIESDV